MLSDAMLIIRIKMRGRQARQRQFHLEQKDCDIRSAKRYNLFLTVKGFEAGEPKDRINGT